MHIDVREETEIDRGWAFAVRASTSTDAADLIVRLSWVDYDHWSRGAASPARVIEELLRIVLEHVPLADLTADFDAARLRRRVPELDALLQRRL